MVSVCWMFATFQSRMPSQDEYVSLPNTSWPGRVHLQQLRAVGVAPEGRMNDHAPSDLVAPVDDVRLSAENLAEDLVDGLGRISADGAARAPARIRVHPADVSTVERVRVA